jgi:hypothetical protein
MGGKQGSSNEIRAVTPNSMDETYEASNGDFVGAIELNEASITEWISTHKKIIAAIDTIQDVHNDAYFRCKEAIETINKHSDVLSEYEGFYEKVYDYKVPVRRPWIPMEMEYRSVLGHRYRAK